MMQVGDPRSALIGSVVLLTLFTLSLTGIFGIQAYGRHQEAQQILLANEMADKIIRASEILALERGTTSAALGSRIPSDSPLARKITELRNQANLLWEQSLELAGELAQSLPANKNLESTLNQVQQAHQQVREARQRFDLQLQNGELRINIDEWFEVTTRFITLTSKLRRTAVNSVRLPQDLALLTTSVRERVWQASEHAGRERGILAFHISAHEPLTADSMGELAANDVLLKRNIDLIQSIELESDKTASIKLAIEHMQQVFLNDYTAVRDTVYAAAKQGAYPLNALDWLEHSTRAIDSILAVSAATTWLSNAYAQEAIDQSRQQLYIAFGLIIATLLTMALNFAKVRQMVNLLFQQKELAEVTLHSIGDAVISTDELSRVEYLNPVAEELTGWSTEQAKGKLIKEIFHIINAITREPEPNPINICLREKRVAGFANQTILIRPDGKETQIEDSAAPIRDREGHIVGAVMVFYEHGLVDGKSHLLSYNATHDSLTRLINRREFESRFKKLLDRTKNTDQQHALCYLDLDQFKIVNDTCGHLAGDRLLRQLTHLLQEHVRETDVLARLGGDEFGLLLIGCGLTEAQEIADKIRRLIKDFRFVWKERTFEIGVSIGLVPITSQSINPAEILSEADAACFAAKDNGRNCIQVYEPSNIELTRRHDEMHWVSRITEALANERLTLYCQTITPITHGLTAHAEILVRMLDDNGNTIPPMSFLPAAERYSLMPQIDRWVIDNALDFIGRRNREGHAHQLIFNINISGASLGDPMLGSYIEEQLATHQVPARLVCFEITETTAVSNLELAREFISRLRSIGCQFALDDFGSGLSSFTYLKNLPVDYLKIDGNLIESIDKDPVSCGMVEAIHRVGQLMEVMTVAEYVSNEQILSKLQEIGVDFAQGYAVSMPCPIGDCELVSGTLH